MKSILHALSLALLLLSFSLLAVSEPPRIEAKDHLPYEFKLLIETANTFFTSPQDHFLLVDNLKVIDAHLANVKKEEQFFFIKAEIYKEVLRFKPDNELTARFIDPQTIEALSKKEKEYKDNSYISWLIRSIRDDLEPLLNSSTRNTYLFQKQSKTPITDKELRKFEGRLRILLPWAMLFLQKTPDEVNLYCKELMKRTLTSIKLALVEFHKITKIKEGELPADIYKLSNFKVTHPQKVEKVDKIDSLRGELLGTDFNQPRPDSESWVPKEEAASLPQVLFPTPDPNYTPPPELPQATSDWQREYLFPAPDPAYEPPQELPQAKNDWDQEYLYPTPDPNYVPPATMPVPTDSWESARP